MQCRWHPSPHLDSKAPCWRFDDITRTKAVPALFIETEGRKWEALVAQALAVAHHIGVIKPIPVGNRPRTLPVYQRSRVGDGVYGWPRAADDGDHSSRTASPTGWAKTPPQGPISHTDTRSLDDCEVQSPMGFICQCASGLAEPQDKAGQRWEKTGQWARWDKAGLGDRSRTKLAIYI
ncbi:hypothetical protein SKAU_G00096390 [Synaphobranchus kaupii]|uniref:Uncharacterized protein n=1 Tax=Synaphobranchus kaupii TaxID=118154 RepID=A0A9Q1FXQ7_SYNKA|nr:hypothetical protein SKAU_G00096390 [Synaphobranchus kaupii]